VLRHVVVMRFLAGTPPEAVEAVEAGLAELPARIAEVRAFAFGRDAGLAAGNADLAVVADFDDAAAYASYAAHPAHVELVATRIRPILAERSAVQFLLDGDGRVGVGR